MVTWRRLWFVLTLFAAAILPLGVAPVATDAATTPAMIAVSAGGRHACALTNVGGVKCWGYGFHGQLGTGTASTSLTPVGVAGLASGVAAVALGDFSTCALTTGGRVMCWGWNKHGQLGNGTTTNSSVPVNVAGLASGVTAITAGGYGVCALTGAGGVECWGNGSLVPVSVAGLTSRVTAISTAGSDACALTTGGVVMCWGLGDRSTPVGVAGLAVGVSAISVGGGHTCALTGGGGSKCWGINGFGQLGDGTMTDRSVPVDVTGLTSGVTAITAGFGNTCALTAVGGVKCWGTNDDGQLGDGTTTNSSVPVDVLGLTSGVTAISAAYHYTCALTNRGGLKCWGSNIYGQLGNGTRTSSSVPVDVVFATNQTLALRSSMPAGRITPGTAVTFSATVRPLGAAGDRATVRFEIYRLDNGVWRRTANRDVVADATGQANLRWTFVTTGSRYVRARALATAADAASPWSARVQYVVGP